MISSLNKTSLISLFISIRFQCFSLPNSLSRSRTQNSRVVSSSRNLFSLPLFAGQTRNEGAQSQAAGLHGRAIPRDVVLH